MDDLEKLLNERLENKEFKKEWEEFQPELQLMKEVIGKKIKENISQKKLSDKNNCFNYENSLIVLLHYILHYIKNWSRLELKHSVLVSFQALIK